MNENNKLKQIGLTVSTLASQTDNTKAKRKETTTQRKWRLEKERKKCQEKLANETEENCLRLDNRNQRLQDESQEQRETRLLVDRQRHALSITNETQKQRELRLQDFIRHGRNLGRSIAYFGSCAIKSHSHSLRLQDLRRRQALTIENETPEQHETQLQDLRRRQALTIENETQEQREATKEIQHSQAQRRVKTQIASFERAINTFCDRTCEICTKRCYPNQVAKCYLTETKAYLPDELRHRSMLLLCHRCKNHINSNKDHSPPKAYWNNLDPGPIPRELQELTQIEIRQLVRIKPFITIIKFDGVLGQYVFRAQAVLFAQDLHEIAEKLSNMRLRPTNNLDVVVVTETRENLNISREFSIDPSRANRALK
ncbi:uncharacterized protein NPIL_246441 [Nephila pilipes]|uniref:DUF6570 domain-containing protein n=1 Tax=Nephila pilipes TaxID=299642 RepID=A0A8X6PQS9_NEPPI|nr:uncharacterized protein NPIL_246441 [Nephila pilipes]